MTSTTDTVTWGFIGASLWASAYVIPAVKALPEARTAGVFSSSRERGERFATDNGLDRAYSSLEDLLADPAIDAVYISTTNDLHAEQTIAAAHAGKHILCEKPLAMTLEDALRMRAACERAGVVWATNHAFRGAATAVAMRNLVETGAIGDVVAGRVLHSAWLPQPMQRWRVNQPDAGGGVIRDLMVHDVDTMRYLLGDEVAQVWAVTANQGLAVEGLEDSAMGVLQMRGGALVSFHDAYTVPYAGSRIELHGTRGSLVGNGVLAPDPGGSVLLRRSESTEEIEIPEHWPLYEHAVRRLTSAIQSKGLPLASGEDGIASLAVALAALESSRTGTSVRPAWEPGR